MSGTEQAFQDSVHAHEVMRVEYQKPAEPVAVTEPDKDSNLAQPSASIYVPPTKGMPAVQYRMQQRLKKINPNHTVVEVQPGKAEQFERQLVRIADKQEELRFLTVSNQRIVTSVNAKGGAGKTPNVGYLSCIQMDVTRDPVQFIDANKNAGTANLLMGISRHSTILLRQAVARRHDLVGYADHAKAEAKHKSGVRFIGSDLEENEQTGFKLAEFNEMVRLNDRAFHTLYLDNGNGFSDVSNLGCLESANALVFSVLADKPSSFEGLVITMNKYIELGFEAKVHGGFVVINATQPGDTKQQYIDRIAEVLKNHPRLNVYNPETQVTEDIARTIQDLGISEDRLFLIPYSQHIKDDKVISTDPVVIGYDTYEALLDVLIAMFKQNAYYDPPKIRNVAFSDGMAPIAPQHVNA